MNAATNDQGRLTTHVLDTANGTPAAGMKIDLYKVDNGAKSHILSIETNDDGRADSPLMEGDRFQEGVYELVFQVGQYFSRGEDISFLDEVPIRFGINNADEHYHVPLLVSPFSFSTYRGS